MVLNMFAVLAVMVLAKEISADLPCVAQFYTQSSVCVCNATYCDTITRTEPKRGTYVTYTSTKAGLRFDKQTGSIGILGPILNNGRTVFEINPKTSYQTIEGFGGASTDAAGMNWKSLPLQAQQKLINSYFSDEGIEYNMLRLPIAASDFSTRFYTYQDQPANDFSLSNFTLAPDDYDFKIPLITAAKDVATDVIKILSASWSPPLWMKQPMEAVGKVSVKPEYYQVFADYLCKFAEAYKENGIDIWGMTPSNEPMNTLFGVRFQGTLWSTPEMVRRAIRLPATFIGKFFGPTLKEKCSVKGIKLLSNDDQRSNIPLYYTMLQLFDQEALQYLDGVAVHSYINPIVPASIVKLNMIPGKFAISSEFSAGGSPLDQLKVDLGSWDRTISYFEDILENLNIDFVGWIDWNLCLNREGGPNWANNFVDSPIIVDAEKKEFYKQPMFYALGHFSKFVPRGSKRINIEVFGEDDSTASNESCNQEPSKKHIAFLTSSNTIVVIVLNKGPARKALLRVDGTGVINTSLEADSFTTFEIPNKKSM